MRSEILEPLDIGWPASGGRLPGSHGSRMPADVLADFAHNAAIGHAALFAGKNSGP